MSPQYAVATAYPRFKIISSGQRELSVPRDASVARLSTTPFSLLGRIHFFEIGTSISVATA